MIQKDGTSTGKKRRKGSVRFGIGKDRRTTLQLMLSECKKLKR